MTTVDHQSNYLDDVLARLDDVITDLSELSLTSLPVDQLNRVLVRKCELVSQAQGLQMAAIQQAESAGMSQRFGTRILTTRLANETHQPAKALGSARSTALWLSRFPAIHDALIAGSISRSHVAELKAIDNPPHTPPLGARPTNARRRRTRSCVDRLERHRRLLAQRCGS